jgi:regulator of protease activity HflC (stomatin/prohibitin superfamily)
MSFIFGGITFLILIISLWVAVIGFLTRKKDEQVRNKDERGWPMDIVGSLVFVVVFLWCSVVIMPTGSVGVLKTFGIVDLDYTVPEGSISLKAPWQWVEKVDVRVHKLTLAGNTSFVGKSSDNVEVYVGVMLPIRINPVAAPYIGAKIKGDWTVYVTPFVTSALRDAVSQAPWRETYNANRAGFALTLQQAIQAKLAQNLVENGFPKSLAQTAFLVSDPQIGGVNVPTRIQDALNSQNAVEIDKATSIGRALVAENDVRTREAEGKGYGSLLTSLPPGVSPASAASMMLAQARLKEVEVLKDGIDKKVITSITIVTGSANASVPAGK